MDHNESLLRQQPGANDNANDNDDGGVSNDDEVYMLAFPSSCWDHVFVHTHQSRCCKSHGDVLRYSTAGREVCMPRLGQTHGCLLLVTSCQ